MLIENEVELKLQDWQLLLFYQVAHVYVDITEIMWNTSQWINIKTCRAFILSTFRVLDFQAPVIVMTKNRGCFEKAIFALTVSWHVNMVWLHCLLVGLKGTWCHCKAICGSSLLCLELWGLMEVNEHLPVSEQIIIIKYTIAVTSLKWEKNEYYLVILHKIGGTIDSKVVFRFPF